MDLVAFDPGVTTGVCVFNNGRYRSYELNLKEYPSPHAILYDHISDLKPAQILYENFYHRQQQLSSVYTGIEYIGIISLWAQNHGIGCYSINPGEGKKFWDDKKLKALGVYLPSRPHAMDATRILLLHQYKTGMKDEILEKLRQSGKFA